MLTAPDYVTGCRYHRTADNVQGSWVVFLSTFCQERSYRLRCQKTKAKPEKSLKPRARLHILPQHELGSGVRRPGFLAKKGRVVIFVVGGVGRAYRV